MNTVLDPKTTALLVMDMQSVVLDLVGDKKEAVLTRTAELLEAARRARALVIYVVVEFRAGYPEFGPQPRSPAFVAIHDSGRLLEGKPGSEIHPRVAPKPGEVVITKHRVSAFSGTGLEIILRANRVDTLVLAGVATGGAVLSTVRHAADAEYRVVVAADCCTDRDDEVHRVLTEKVFPRQAEVVAAKDVFSS